MDLYHSLTIGRLTLSGNIFLAPVAGYSDRAFRAICIEQGADFTSTELVSSEALSRNPNYHETNSPTLTILRRADNEKRYSIQLFGANPDIMYKAAAMLNPWQPATVDVNAGCPVSKVVKTGAGSALMKNPLNLGHIVEAVTRASQEHLGNVPVTVKMRSGWDASSINYLVCSRIAIEAGAAMISLHPRTRSRAYAGTSNWEHIADLASHVTVPVAGSGDLFSPEDAERMLRETACAAVLFARGAIGNPFIFSSAKSLLTTGSYRTPDTETRLKTGFRQLALLTEDIGEEAACREMRKQFCAYTKGIAGSAEMRNRLVHAKTIAEYQLILEQAQFFTDFLSKRPKNPIL